MEAWLNIYRGLGSAYTGASSFFFYDDPDTGAILRWKEAGVSRPDRRDVSGMSRAIKAYWSQWDLFHVRGGVLYRLWVSDSGEQNTYLLVVPHYLRSDILYELHNSPTGGHLGQKKTRAKVTLCLIFCKYKC